MIDPGGGQIQKLTRLRRHPKFRCVVTVVHTLFQGPKVRGLGPPEVTRVMSTRTMLKIDSYGVMIFQSLDTQFVLVYVEIREVLDPIVDTWIGIVVSHSLGMKVKDIKIFGLSMVVQWMKGCDFIQI
jgi:hypothetical protein